MSESIVIAILSLAGNLAGSIVAIIVANKLLTYRVDKLEEKLTKIDSIESRVYKAETANALQDEKIDQIITDTTDIKTKLGRMMERATASA